MMMNVTARTRTELFFNKMKDVGMQSTAKMLYLIITVIMTINDKSKFV